MIGGAPGSHVRLYALTAIISGAMARPAALLSVLPLPPLLVLHRVSSSLWLSTPGTASASATCQVKCRLGSGGPPALPGRPCEAASARLPHRRTLLLSVSQAHSRARP